MNEQADNQSTVTQQSRRPAWFRRTLPLAVLGAALALTPWLRHLWTHTATDNAYVAGRVHMVSARVPGTVVEVLVDDNQRVVKGQPLLRLDPADCQVRVDEARARHARARADFDRLLPLKDDEAISRQDFDEAEAAEKITRAQLEDAENQLAYCTVNAPADGRVGRKAVETGNRVASGAALLAVVQDCWVVANFKETQLADMRPGQRVSIHIDAIGGKKFAGYVDSFAPGTGAVFALLPPDNATGNFTKVVQRVPVKIRFDADSVRGYEDRIVAGLSVTPTVDLRSAPEGKGHP
ncbi:MAG: HlyD family secretion protein [Verrucomicrobiales bacterium]|jgi:membrane fusion protein (multidrug efflux system)|nr:HlyD family secretion protein [Verrucomicrobiales bacterium]